MGNVKTGGLMDRETEEQIGWNDVWDLFQPASSPGKRYKAQLQPFLPTDPSRWQEDRQDLQLMRKILRVPAHADSLTQAIRLAESIEPLFRKVLADAVLQPAELFKWKQWMWKGRLLTKEIEKLRHNKVNHDRPTEHGNPSNSANTLLVENSHKAKHPSDWDDWFVWWPVVDWEEVMRLLHPQPDWSTAFSVDEGYDPVLKQIRFDKRQRQQEIDRLRKEQTDRLRLRYGKLPNRERELIWAREETGLIELADADSELTLVGETSWEKIFRVQDAGPAVSLLEELDRLSVLESERERAVLARISSQLTGYVDLFRACETAWGRLDWLITRILTAKRRNWSFPVWTEDIWKITDGYHPMLAVTLEQRGRMPTPVSFALTEGVSLLTGPNMGGKTVSLRTAGLLQAMAQYGLPVPAVTFEFVPVDQIRFVGGDLQSLKDGLSTFGGEIRRLASILQMTSSKLLLLLDEVGRGTNPLEGEALAIGVTRFLQQTSWLVWFATHYPRVSEMEGIIRWQVAGLTDHRIIPTDSAAERFESLRIAKDLGLPQPIVEYAGQWMLSMGRKERWGMSKLQLDPSTIARARRAAAAVANDVARFIEQRSTVAVERTVLRLFGLDGVDANGVPLPNVVTEHIQSQGRLAEGAARPVVNAMLQTGWSIQEVGEAVAAGNLNLFSFDESSEAEIRAKAESMAQDVLVRIRNNRERRTEWLQIYGDRPQPYLYVIVATGNIYEDVVQARAAARQGADIIAVIRSTGQSLLDYVPFGPTTEGFGGTYATQANFRIVRQALDEVGEELGRYIRLCNYCSGLCMPEIAAMGAMERLDVMLNDALYGILFRDINMQRTLVDQNFSRMVNAYAGVIINTGEDNYLTTADAVEAAHTVLASQFINEQLALLAGLKEEQMGLGHAFEMDPQIEDGFLLEVAQAQMAREIFPNSPLKYMPPTKHMTGNIFRGHVQNSLFNLAGIMTGQGIQLLGMMTEAIHTPLVHERHLAIEAARYIFHNARHLADEIEFKPDGIIVGRARHVLHQAVELLEEIAKIGLFEALSKGIFADVKRSMTGGKGLAGVFERAETYMNPIERMLKQELNLTGGKGVSA